MNLKESIRAKALELGFDQCHFTSSDPPEHAAKLRRWLDEGQHGEMHYLKRNAHKRSDPAQVLPTIQSVICLAVSYALPANPPPRDTSPASSPPGAGIIARYARFNDYHDVLSKPLQQLTAWIDQLSSPPSRSLYYIDTGPILERDLAHRAGLGFSGKHTNLISRHLGNWFFLAEILTPLQLPPDTPEHNRCGTCTRCIPACPTGAITAPFNLDARKCISYLTIELKGSIPEELRPALGRRIYGCDDCLQACPWNRFARQGRLMQQASRPDLSNPDLLELLQLTDDQFRQRFQHTPIYRSKRRALLRNVCVALGNVGDPSALPHLNRAAQDPEPLIAEHAAWAIRQIEHRHKS